MNFPLFFATLKANYRLWFIFLFVLLMYGSIILSIYDPNNLSALESLFELLPADLMKAMNFNILAPTLFGYLAGYYYGFIFIMFPMIYIMITGNRMIAAYVDKGSMSFLLSTPNSRINIATTQALYNLLSTIFLLATTALILNIISNILFPGALNGHLYILLNLNVIGLYVLLSGITFLTSCLFNESRLSIGFGAGILVVFFLLNMLANFSDQLSFLKYLTVFSLFNVEQILNLDPTIILNMIILFGLGFSLYIIGIAVFNHKNLPI